MRKAFWKAFSGTLLRMVRIRCVASSREGTPSCSSPQLPNSSFTRAAWSHRISPTKSAMLCHALPCHANDAPRKKWPFKKKDNHDKSEILLINHMLLIFWASNFETIHVGLLWSHQQGLLSSFFVLAPMASGTRSAGAYGSPKTIILNCGPWDDLQVRMEHCTHGTQAERRLEMLGHPLWPHARRASTMTVPVSRTNDGFVQWGIPKSM